MNKTPVRWLLLSVAVVAVGAIIYWKYTPKPPGNGNHLENLVVLDNGLTKADRADFYHLTEGSEIYPVLWLRALKTNTGKYFLEDAENLGFLPDPDRKDGLPVGLTNGTARGLEALGPMTGLNCAACHVGELHYQGKRVRIDGAPNLVNTRSFFVTIIESALDTAKDPAKLIAFIAKVHEIEDADQKVSRPKIVQVSRTLFVKLADKQEAALHAALKPVLDALIKDEFAAEPFDFKAALKDDIKDAEKFRAKIAHDLKLDNVAELVKHSTVLKELKDEAQKHGALMQAWQDLYVKLRLLRGRAEFLKKLGMVGDDKETKIWGPGRVDAFGSARAFLFQSGYRPLTPVSYPPLFELDSHKWFHYDNNTNTFLERNFGQALGVGAVWDEKAKLYSLQPKNLRKLEALAHKIAAPKWPEAVFGKIDQARAKRGQKLYQEFCAACHDADKNKDFDKLEELTAISTNTARATMFAEDVPTQNRPFPDRIRETLADIKKVALKEFDANEQKEIEKDPVTWRGPKKYAARSIKGAWATAPYLHNGSVPTIDDLLKPANKRCKTFYVGSRSYDVEKLGYISDDKMTLFDTTQLGNSNAGHEGKEYGTDMSPEDRKDLCEFLKTQ